MADSSVPEAARPGAGQERLSLIRRMSETRSFLGKVWRLAAPYWWCDEIGIDTTVLGMRLRIPERWIARGLLAVIIGMAVFLVWMSKQLNSWNAQFFNALQDKNQEQFYGLLFSTESLSALFFSFTGLVFVWIVVAVYRLWLRQLLTIRWRRWLTGVYFRDWLGERTYYRMELVSHGTDNPEQRIEQDVNSFTQQTLTIGLGLLSEVMTLVTFSVVLWNLSGAFTLPFTDGVAVPGYMMWVAIIYAAIGSWATYKIGWPLVRVNFNMERYNADFRYRMTRVRENAESIALYGGETDERRRLHMAFDRIYDTWWEYMRYNKRLTWLTSFYYQVASIFPIVVSAPRYFSGEVPLGTLTQTAGAFAQVQGSLSWFVDTYGTLADWKAVVDRLTSFGDTMLAVKKESAQQAFAPEASRDGGLHLQDVVVGLPDGRTLLGDVDIDIAPGDRVVLQGPSGSGKTTLFRVLAGLWPFGRGRVATPPTSRVLFLPQKPYLPIGTLREALSYPQPPSEADTPAALELLDACNLSHLKPRLDETANWSMTLSPGEQQRLSFARALFQKPDWLFLDEATSALDERNEVELYELLGQRLPQVTLVSIAHKPSVLRFHERRLRLDPASGTVHSERLEAEPADA